MIIDETHTLSEGYGGYTRAHNLKPDFVTLGKSIAGGVPISVYGFTKEITDASEYWKEGYVGFLIGCSFSFEEALIREGIDVRHITQGRNVPMFKVGIQTTPAGPFSGPMVCSMRPMTPENAQKAYDIAAKSYEIGRSTLTDLDAAQLALTQAQLAASQAIYNYLVAKAGLESTIGADYTAENTTK
jgi:hypothetical protein